jgi:hypothetical protein
MARSISPRGGLLCARNQYFYPKFCRIATTFVHLRWATACDRSPVWTSLKPSLFAVLTVQRAEARF